MLKVGIISIRNVCVATAHMHEIFESWLVCVYGCVFKGVCILKFGLNSCAKRVETLLVHDVCILFMCMCTCTKTCTFQRQELELTCQKSPEKRDRLERFTETHLLGQANVRIMCVYACIWVSKRKTHVRVCMYISDRLERFTETHLFRQQT